MRCKNCKARKMEGSEYPEEYCCIGIYDDELNEDRNGDLGCNLHWKEYLRDLEIFVRFRLHSSYPLREICDVTKTERKECHESYNHLVHLRNPETEEKWRLENLINHAWQQYVDLYTEGKEREYLLTYFHCSIMNFIDGHLEDGINYYFFPESKANSLILL